jgi:uncharacterized membrane protein
MHSSQLQYLPIALPFFSLLVLIFLFLLILLQLGLLRYAYLRLGVSPGTAVLLLLGSLIGSYINIPVAQLPEQQIVSGTEVDVFGMRYVVPSLVDWPGTIIAVNVGGAVIPTLLSLYLLAKNNLWLRGLVAIVGVAAVCYALATPVKGVGIAVPILVPPLASVVIALLLSRQYTAPLAYVGGSLGTLIGADLLNLDKIQGLGAPVASIGGAGTFDGIFLSGILAVLFASVAGRGER